MASPKMTQKKKYMLVFLVTFSSIVYLIPYLAYDFYNQFIIAYGVSDGQLGWLLSAFGVAAIPGYFFGGWIADIFDAKKLIVLSCYGTAAVAIAVCFCKSFPMLVFLFFLFGVTSIMLNWSAYLKIVKMLGDDDEQGKLFAGTDVAYTLFSVILEYTVILLTMTYFVDIEGGFRYAYIIYAVLTVIIGIGIQILLPNYEYENDFAGKGLKSKFSLMGKAAKLPVTWCLGIFTLGYFIIRSVVPYVNPYMYEVDDYSITFAQVYTTTIRTFSLMIFSPVGGVLRDKLGQRSNKLIVIFSGISMVFAAGMIVTPSTAKWGISIMVLAVFMLIFNALQSNYLYTMVTDANVPLLYVGSVYGIASAIGYSSDLWLYTIVGNLIDKDPVLGYNVCWAFGVLGGLMMLVIGLILSKVYKHSNEIFGDAPKLSEV
jgi:MFS family permease